MKRVALEIGPPPWESEWVTRAAGPRLLLPPSFGVTGSRRGRGPPITRGLRGRRPRPRGGRSAGPDDRHTMEAKTSPARPRCREPPARHGSRKVPELAHPVGGGEKTGPRAPANSSGRGGYLQPLSATPLSHLGHPQRGEAPSSGFPTVACATAVPPHLPVDAIFSPSSSFSQRPTPSRFPSRRRPDFIFYRYVWKCFFVLKSILSDYNVFISVLLSCPLHDISFCIHFPST